MNPQQVSTPAAEVLLNAPSPKKPDAGPPKTVPDKTEGAAKPAASQPRANPPKAPGTGPGKATGDKVPMVLNQQTQPDVVKKPQLPDKAPPADPPKPVAPQASPSRFRMRHALVLLSFLLMVVGPGVIAALYLWTRAADQYASYMGFSVRTEEAASSIASLLGPLDIGGGGTPDADILYAFIQSQDLVARVDAKLDLRSIWSKADPDVDPIYAYHPPGTIEDLLEHWKRKVRLVYDSSNGLLELRVLAFTPEDAQSIATVILRESTMLINNLSALAREDAIGYARDELDKAVIQLKDARSTLTAFRNRTQIVDPTIDVQGQAGILNTLHQQLAEALISLDLLTETTREGDPRISQSKRRIKVIEARIEDEKKNLGIGAGNTSDEAYATLVGEFETLVVDREFAEQTYTAARVAFDGAQAEALRQTRYLATHISPTLAEKAEYPERVTVLGLIVLFAFLLWSVVVLVGYSLRDRR